MPSGHRWLAKLPRPVRPTNTMREVISTVRGCRSGREIPIVDRCVSVRARTRSGIPSRPLLRDFKIARVSISSNFLDLSATSERLACSVGGESHRGKSRNPVAWVASAEETKRRKPTDKAVLGMVSESPGRNESEPTGGLDRNYSEGRALYGRAKAAWHVAD